MKPFFILDNINFKGLHFYGVEVGFEFKFPNCVQEAVCDNQPIKFKSSRSFGLAFDHDYSSKYVKKIKF